MNEALEMVMQQQLGGTPDDLKRCFTDIFIGDKEDIDDLIFRLQLALVSPRQLSREKLYFAISFANCGLVRREIDLQTCTVIDTMHCQCLQGAG
ncbi:hypothetical protein BDW71DRAFT_104020 [Aspergillus fruticulosus]